MIARCLWLGRARAAMNLLERYDEEDQVPRLLVKGTYNIADHPNGLTALYTVLLDEYPQFLKYFMNAEVDPGEGDDSRPNALEHGIIRPVSLSERMKQGGYVVERTYQ